MGCEYLAGERSDFVAVPQTLCPIPRYITMLSLTTDKLRGGDISHVLALEDVVATYIFDLLVI